MILAASQLLGPNHALLQVHAIPFPHDGQDLPRKDLFAIRTQISPLVSAKETQGERGNTGEHIDLIAELSWRDMCLDGLWLTRPDVPTRPCGRGVVERVRSLERTELLVREDVRL